MKEFCQWEPAVCMCKPISYWQEVNMNTDCFQFNLGAFECIAIKDDCEAHPLSDLTTDVPEKQLAQVLREHGYPPEGWNIDFNCLLINTGEHRVLVDAGWGRGTTRRDGKLLQNLQAQAITPKDIDVIVITHSDRDHTGGLIYAEGDLVFANARHIMRRGGWEAWSETDWAKESEDMVAFHRKVLDCLQGRIELVEPETEFLPGFQIIPAVGHRPDHSVLSVSSAGKRLLHLADAIIHPIMIEHEWRWPDHSLPEWAMNDRQQLLERASDQNALVFGSHFPFPGLGYIV
jgi:glyoxylase-like metal-dependent hydrolase (beta-lactamase superfamily II)